MHQEHPPQGPMARRARYPRPDVCLLCMAQPGSTDEHIIPRGLGGELIVKDGTCLDCLGHLTFEQKLINADFEAVRVFLGIPSINGKVRDRLSVPFEQDASGKKIAKKYADKKSHSGIVIFPGYPPAPGLSTKAKDKGPLRLTIKKFSNGTVGNLTISDSAIGDMKFPRLLAKIAHFYWFAENPIGSIHPFLGRFILGAETEGIFNFVGGLDAPLPYNDLHHLAHGEQVIGHLRYAYVDIGLFAYYNPQTNYRVYVGLCL